MGGQRGQELILDIGDCYTAVIAFPSKVKGVSPTHSHIGNGVTKKIWVAEF
jgi:hypothetical protein